MFLLTARSLSHDVLGLVKREGLPPLSRTRGEGAPRKEQLGRDMTVRTGQEGGPFGQDRLGPPFPSPQQF